MDQLWPSQAAHPGQPANHVDDRALLRMYLPDDRAAPCLRLNFVTSLDGAVSVDGYSAGLSGPADKRVFGLLRAVCDALVVGAGTLRHEGYGALDLGERRRGLRRDLGLPADPPLVLVSRRLAFDPAHPIFAAAPVRPVVLVPDAAPADRRAAIAGVADVVVAGEHTVDLAAGLAELHRRGLRQVLCEGGPELFGWLTAADLVDELCLTVSPLLVGPGPGRITAGPPVAAPRRMALRHALATDGVLLLRYVRASGAPG